jgi:hypothetical protein
MVRRQLSSSDMQWHLAVDVVVHVSGLEALAAVRELRAVPLQVLAQRCRVLSPEDVPHGARAAIPAPEDHHMSNRCLTPSLTTATVYGAAAQNCETPFCNIAGCWHDIIGVLGAATAWTDSDC